MSQPENDNTGNISAPQQHLRDMSNNKMGNVSKSENGHSCKMLMSISGKAAAPQGNCSTRTPF